MKKIFSLLCFILLAGAFVQAQTVNVTFQADMRVAIATHYFDPATDTLTCPGDFDNWLNEPPANTTKIMTDPDANGIYTITLAMAPDSTYGYKFNIGMGWDGKDEAHGNRSVDIGASDTTLPVCFYNNYTPYTGVVSPVTFSVDMHLPAKGDFHIGTDTVWVAGNFSNWATGGVMMEDQNGDSIYTVTVDTILSGTVLYYKFLYGHTGITQATWESPQEGDDIINLGDNRAAGVVDGADTLSRFWNNTNPYVTTGDGHIYFEVDMSVPHELGVFNPDVDSVQIRGAFNGWNASTPEKSLMNQNPANPDDWYIDMPFVQAPLNSSQAYKFFINNGSGSTQYANGGWEVPIGNTITGDRNRSISFEGNDTQEAGLAHFANIHPDWVIPSGTSVEVTFSVDMTNAASADSQGTNPVFNPATDTVYWVPRQPLFYSVNGLTWESSTFVPAKYLKMTDDNQDMVYTGTMTIDGPNFNGFLYDYGFTSGGNLIQEGNTVTQGDARVRFIGQSGGARKFDSPWTMPVDVWSNHALPEETAPMGWVEAVKEIPNTPRKYSLEQNYPNPFNPSTIIRFSVATQGLVTLKVYNILGQQVANLLNGELKSGTYEVDFDGTNFSSGVYFYTIKAGNYVSTKKMVLLK